MLGRRRSAAQHWDRKGPRGSALSARQLAAVPHLRVLLLAAPLLFISASDASAVAIIQDPFPSAAEAANIADLTNQYLQAAQGATTEGGWLDAAPGGTADRGQSLLLPSTVVPDGKDLDGPPGPTPPGTPSAGHVIIRYSNAAVNGIVSFNDGGGGTGTLSAALTQFIAAYGNSNGTTTSFFTFCIDLEHTVSTGQDYAVTPRSDVKTAFANGAAMAYIIDNFGSGDLTSNPDQAAAVQIALWDLSLNGHTPTFFVQDADGTYSSGDKSVFNVAFAKVPEPSSAAILFASTLLLGIASLLRRPPRPCPTAFRHPLPRRPARSRRIEVEVRSKLLRRGANVRNRCWGRDNHPDRECPKSTRSRPSAFALGTGLHAPERPLPARGESAEPDGRPSQPPDGPWLLSRLTFGSAQSVRIFYTLAQCTRSKYS